MELTTLGRTGITVSQYCLGAMMFGRRHNGDHDECARMVHRAMDAGINFIDTADVYGAGESETIVGKALKGRRDKVVLATKFGIQMGADPNMRGASRRWILRAFDDSLERLQTDYIDLYQLHRLDPSTDADETLGALSDLVRQGKLRAIGTSTFPAELIVEWQWTAERRGRERVVCEQPPYSIFARSIEAAVLPVCRRYGLGVICWSPLAGGWLTGRYRSGGKIDSSRTRTIPAWYDESLPRTQKKYELVDQLVALAGDTGVSLTHLAMAWVLEHPVVTSAIIGPRTMEQLEDILAGEGTRLSADVLDRVDKIVPPGTSIDPPDPGAVPAGLHRSARRRSYEEATK